jgi:menaquinone-dependent protoporphyrinogen oxidase
MKGVDRTSNVLVAYASKHGSTREVAEVICATLQERGDRVELRPADDVRGSIGRPDLVVLGGAIYAGGWHHDAHRFLRKHRRELSEVPLAVFGMGPRVGTEEGWQRSRGQLDQALAKRGWLTPVAVTVFGGVDPVERKGDPRRDLRDWDVIRAWAGEVAGLASTP